MSESVVRIKNFLNLLNARFKQRDIEPLLQRLHIWCLNFNHFFYAYSMDWWEALFVLDYYWKECGNNSNCILEPAVTQQHLEQARENRTVGLRPNKELRLAITQKAQVRSNRYETFSPQLVVFVHNLEKPVQHNRVLIKPNRLVQWKLLISLSLPDQILARWFVPLTYKFCGRSPMMLAFK